MNQGNFTYCVAWVGLAAGLSGVGCGSSNDSGRNEATASTAPTIAITSPVTGAVVSPSSEPAFPDIPVTLDVKNFTLKNPYRADGSSCPTGTCGHGHFLVDSNDGDFTQCNDTGVSYNSSAVSLTDNIVGLDYCPTINGIHNIKAELYNDDESPVLGGDGKIISSNIVSITATGELDGG